MFETVFRLGNGLQSAHRLQALTLLGHIVKRQPTWLIKITNHFLLKELIKLLKVYIVTKIIINYNKLPYLFIFQSENDIITITSALLVLNVLLTVIPAFISAFLPDIFDGFRYLHIITVLFVKMYLI